MTTVNQALRCAAIALTVLCACAGSASAAPAASPTSLHVVTAPAIKATAANGKRKVSPYARAAAAHNKNAAQITAGRTPTLVQGMGRPRKTHGGGAP